jgi:lipoyl(octanoyl) transferase
MQNRSVFYRDIGLMRFQQAWDYQESLLKSGLELKTQNRHQGASHVIPHYLLFCEHPPVYTLGKSGKIEHLLLNESELLARNIDYHHINRGGDITFHGPGQIVGYPIFDLESFTPDLHLYLRNLEEACILTLAHYGLTGARIDGLTGVWVGADSPDPRKIMAIGVRCARWITMHGFAFNVNTDLDYFNHIIPCGIDDKGVTSLAKELGRTLDMEEVKTLMRENLASLFGFTFGAE